MTTRFPWLIEAARRPWRTGTPPKACGIVTCQRSALTCVTLASPSWAGSIPSTARCAVTKSRTKASMAAALALRPPGTGNTPTMEVAAPERGSIVAWRCPGANPAVKAIHASRPRSWSRIPASGACAVVIESSGRKNCRSSRRPEVFGEIAKAGVTAAQQTAATSAGWRRERVTESSFRERNRPSPGTAGTRAPRRLVSGTILHGKAVSTNVFGSG